MDEYCFEAADDPQRDDIAAQIMLLYQAGISGLEELKVALKGNRYA